MKQTNELEIKEAKEQYQQELSTLNNLLYQITRATTTEEIFNLMFRANIYLSYVCRDKEYILKLEQEK